MDFKALNQSDSLTFAQQSSRQTWHCRCEWSKRRRESADRDLKEMEREQWMLSKTIKWSFTFHLTWTWKICHLWQRKCSSLQISIRWMWARIGLTGAGEEKLEDYVNERMRHVIWRGRWEERRGDSVTRQVFFSSALCLSFFFFFFLSMRCNWWD